jgi:ubiquinone/menaquinone biosynthesis C-methylase UbiE
MDRMTDTDKSIAAYDDLARVCAYDADMDIMHPNRHRMAEVIVEVLAAGEHTPSAVLDLGTGTGFLLQRLLSRCPGVRAVALDGARAMLDLARARLGRAAERVDFRVGDFRSLADLCRGAGPFDAVVSSFALHHLPPEDKRRLVRTAFAMLNPGGWFLDADIIRAESDYLEELTQRMRVRGIVERAAGRDQRFADQASTHAFLQAMEEKEGDQPQGLASDLEALTSAGLEYVTVFWRETREVVIGGIKTRG